MRRRIALCLVVLLAGIASGVARADHFDSNAGTGSFNPQLQVTVSQSGSPLLVNRPTSFTLKMTQTDHEDPPVVTRLRTPGDWNYAFSSTRQAENSLNVPTTRCTDAIDNRNNSPNGTGTGTQLDFSKRTDAFFARAERIGTGRLLVHADGVSRPGDPILWNAQLAFISYDAVADTAQMCALFITNDPRVTQLPDPNPANTRDDIEGVTEIVGQFPVARVTEGGVAYWETLVDLTDLIKDSTLQELKVSVLELTSSFTAQSVGNWHAGGITFSRGSVVSGTKSFQGSFKTCPADDPSFGSCKSGRPDVTRTSTFAFTLPAPAITAPASGTLTNVNPVSVSGTADPGASVQVFSGSNAAGSPATADGAGAWTASVPLADGTHSLTAKTVDAGGASPASNSRTVTVDTTPPAAPVIVSPAEGQLHGGTAVTISGTAEPLSTVQITEAGLPLATVVSTGTWSTTVNLTKGPHAIEARATDPAGNAGASGPLRSFDVTTAAPVVSSPAQNGATNATTVNIGGVAEASALVEIAQDGAPLGSTLASTTGTWTFPHSFPEGTHSLTITATAGGFVSPVVTRTFTVDFTPPEAPVFTAPEPGSTVRSISVPIRGTMPAAEVGASVAVFEGGTRLGTALVDATGGWAMTVILQDGLHRVRAIATDRAGNTGAPSALLSFTVDDPLEITHPAANSFNPGTIEMQGGADPSATQVRLFEGPAEIARVPVVDGAWTATVSFATGTHTVYARAVNNGILGPASPGVTFKVDATPPTVKVKKPQGYTLFGLLAGSPVQGWATDEGPADSRLDRVEVEYRNSLTGETVTRVASCTGCGGPSATWTESQRVLPGFYSVKATAYDKVGNATSETLLFLIV
ncbi:MAG TPA: Ig-like domain-containing protein [Actinomycetota bacterium]|nr:Ig-like domain-containing protein [Actinomycetota bacterium]